MTRSRARAALSPFGPLMAGPLMAWSNLGFKTAEMLIASANVIGHRTQRMAKSSLPPNARDQAEFTLMVEEKAEAAQSAMLAAGTRMITDGPLIALRMAQTAAHIADAALTPVHRAATANAKRLTTPKKR